MVAKYKTRPTLMKAGELAEGDDERSVFHSQAPKLLFGSIGPLINFFIIFSVLVFKKLVIGA